MLSMLSMRDLATTPAMSTDPASPLMLASALPAWQTAARAAYTLDANASDARLRAGLAAGVRALTGCAIPDSAIIVDADARRATVALDGALFQLQRAELVLIRPCAHCGTGQFASAPLSARADLGHALAVWQPYHSGCEPSDPAGADW